MYEILENEVAREFYERDEKGIPRAWIGRVRASMSRLTSRFSSDRMVKQYTEQAYLPAAKSYLGRAAEGAKLAQELQQWHEQLQESWQGIRFGKVEAHHTDDHWQFTVQAFLGELCSDCVQVELYSESPDGDAPHRVIMQCQGHIPGAVNGFNYAAAVPADRPSDHYTPRMIPHHPDAYVPLEATNIHWLR
jgi:starch phosphorylase